MVIPHPSHSAVSPDLLTGPRARPLPSQVSRPPQTPRDEHSSRARSEPFPVLASGPSSDPRSCTRPSRLLPSLSRSPLLTPTSPLSPGSTSCGPRLQAPRMSTSHAPGLWPLGSLWLLFRGALRLRPSLCILLARLLRSVKLRVCRTPPPS